MTPPPRSLAASLENPIPLCAASSSTRICQPLVSFLFQEVNLSRNKGTPQKLSPWKISVERIWAEKSVAPNPAQLRVPGLMSLEGGCPAEGPAAWRSSISLTHIRIT